jgi:molecular chaperone GrpE
VTGRTERSGPAEWIEPGSSAAASDDAPKVVVRDRRKVDPVTGKPREPATEPAAETAGAAAGDQPAAGPAQPDSEPGGADELATARAEAAERTADLQRITAEYANYRKRVDRDRAAVVEGATRAMLAALLPVLDDVDRARAHGDLTGAFKAVADQLETTLEKLGLQPFGDVGEPFDPMVHEAVAHQTSADVAVPTCVAVLRRGYRHGERLLRAPLVAVADPAPDLAPDEEPVAPTDLPAADLEPDLKPDPGSASHAAPEPEPAATSAAGPDWPADESGSESGGDHTGAPELNEDGTPVAWFGPDGEPMPR